jgi:hypothetical protein
MNFISAGIMELQNYSLCGPTFVNSILVWLILRTTSGVLTLQCRPPCTVQTLNSSHACRLGDHAVVNALKVATNFKPLHPV